MSTLSFDEAAIRLHPNDSVAVARKRLPTGTHIGGVHELALRQDIPPGHKFALRRMDANAPVVKYGQVIGFAKNAIEAGDHIHVHNLEIREFDRDYAFGSDMHAISVLPEAQRRTFMGYSRTDGRAATRNYIAVISSVNCSASVSKYVAERSRGDALKTIPISTASWPLHTKAAAASPSANRWNYCSGCSPASRTTPIFSAMS